MKLLSDISLRDKNTLRLDVNAKYFAEVISSEGLQELMQSHEYKNSEHLVVGDGANILFTKDYEGLVIKMGIRGINKVDEYSNKVVVEANAGENWHNLVTYAVENNWGGIENLAYIPGTVGAAPVQNIAAYGQNLTDTFISLSAVNLDTGEKKTFTKEECQFSYRESIFKQELGDKYIITQVRLLLNKNPDLNTSYFETGSTYTKNASLKAELEAIKGPPYSIKDIYHAVINIRTKKLPDFKKIGTAGSFFKNPMVTWQRYQELRDSDPDLQWYPPDNLLYTNDESAMKSNDLVKIPAGRLVDNLGWKGKRLGDVGVYPFQALNIVNYGNATPIEVLDMVNRIHAHVLNKYDINLEPEVRII